MEHKYGLNQKLTYEAPDGPKDVFVSGWGENADGSLFYFVSQINEKEGIETRWRVDSETFLTPRDSEPGTA